MEQLIKTELFKNIDAFINEIDLSMDYLESTVIPSTRKYVDLLKTNDTESLSFVEYTHNHLQIYEVQISAVLFSNKKIKSDYYNFLNDITLFNNLINFKVFESEAKNTKKGLIKYLYSIYMSCVFLSNVSDNSSSSDLSNKLSEFVEKIQNEAQTALKEEDIKTTLPKKTNKRNAIYGLSNTSPGLSKLSELSGVSGLPNIRNLSGMGDLGGIMESILGNKDILSIASDISEQMQSQQLNPMSMLTSLMSGNIENSPLQGLVEEIQQKVETKINNGEIDKDALETQAKNLMGSIGNNPSALNSMPGMSDLIQNMVKDLDKK